MPMKPKVGESQSDFMGRCVPEIIGSGPDKRPRDQAVAACSDIWREAHDKMIHKTNISDDSENSLFVLSDETPDRMGDIIASDGWDTENFSKNPIALFNHKSDFPIGNWKDLHVESSQLRATLELAPKGTSDRIDEIRKLIACGVLKATSVGFRPVDHEPLRSGGSLFKRCELVEASLVAVPANPNALSVAKALNISAETCDIVFAKPGNRSDVVVARSGLTGKPAQTVSKYERGAAMKPLAQRIQETEAFLISLQDALDEHLEKVDDTNVSDAELATTNEYNARITQVKKQLEALQEAEKNVAKTSDDQNSRVPSVITRQSPRPFGMQKKKVAPLELVVRSGVVSLFARLTQKDPDAIRQRIYGDDEATKVICDLTLRAATSPAMTTTVGWAAELVQEINADFMELLLPKSVYPRLAGLGLALGFGRSGRISIPTRSSTPTIAGSFVGEGAPIPVRKGAFTAQVLTPKKMAVITTWTREIDEHSIPAIEGLLRSAIQEDTAVSLDAVLLDANAATTIRPAGLLNGVSALTATTGGGLTALIGDIKQLTAAILTGTRGNVRNLAWLMNPQQVLAAGLQSTSGLFPFKDEIASGKLMGYPIIDSGTVPSGTVIALDGADFVSVGAEGPRFEISDQATLHEEDTTPLAIGSVGTPATVAAPVRSLWQTDSLALRLILPINWCLRRTGTLAWTQAVTW